MTGETALPTMSATTPLPHRPAQASLHSLFYVQLDTHGRDVQQHEYANTCLDEFLATKEDAAWADGVERLPPEQRAVAVATLAVDGGDGGGNPSETPTLTVALVTGSATNAPASGGDEGGAVGSPGKGLTVSGVRVGVGGEAAAGPRLGTLRGLGVGVVKEEEEEEEEGGDELFDMEHHNEYLRDKQVCTVCEVFLLVAWVFCMYMIVF